MATSSARPAAESPRAARTGERGALADLVAYWLVLGGVYVLQGSLWYYSFKEKLFDDNAVAPAAIKKQFDGTIIDSIPGTSAAWTILGILEGLVFMAIVASLVSGEFLPRRRKPWRTCTRTSPARRSRSCCCC